MKKIRYFLVFLAAVTLLSCGGNQGQLVGVQGRQPWFQPDPYGMLYIPMGSFLMGQSDQDVPYTLNNPNKTVSVQPFYMDQEEISNNEYRQFVHWVRDSLARRLLADVNDKMLITEDKYGEDITPPFLNWDTKIKWEDPETREALDQLYYRPNERFFRRKQLDVRKLNYEYYWIDYKAAANDEDRLKHGYQAVLDRSVYIKRGQVNIYPDTLAWIHDFTYSFNEPMAENYFWHPAYDNYPVVGVNWEQARAFCIWRTQLFSSYLQSQGQPLVNDFRLPTETEWEYAARGGLRESPYPWGGPYIRNTRGCFLGNFKPLRGNYIDDGGFHTVATYSYNPNDYGLYCMAGNVAEWTSNVFDEAAASFKHDLNPDYSYIADPDDPPALKRKVIRGGSWKDIGWYLQTGTRAYEYQDTTKSYIGFRCVMTYLGRAKGD